MTEQQDQVIRYKWNSRTETGYRLRYDSQRANHGGFRCYRVEEWTQHCMVDEWGFDHLDEALGMLHRFFDLDIGYERHRIEADFSQAM